MNTNYAKICPRRGTASLWNMYNPILAEGEIGIEYSDTGVGKVKIKFGDGITPWNDLDYGVSSIAEAIYGGTPTSSNDIWLRSGTVEEWLETDPVLGLGEPAFDLTNNSLVIGDGIHKFSELSYIKSSEFVNNVVDFDFGDEDEGE